MLSLISNDFLFKNTLALTTNLIQNINYIKNFKFHDDELNLIFFQRDILSDIGIIKAYILEKEQEQTTTEHHNPPPSLKAAISNLNETLYYLELNIHSLTTKIKNHHLKWFAAYRSYDIEQEKKQIISLIQQLNHRFDLFIKIKS